MNTIDLITLIPRCHAGSRAKGFWDVTPNPGQQLMLVVSELGEALEADRKGRRVTADGIENVVFRLNGGGGSFAYHFQQQIKDTVEDELADAYIRLCDFAGGFGLDVEIIAEGVGCDRHIERPTSPYNNLGADLLDATRRVVAISDIEDDGRDIPYTELAVRRALTELEDLCRQQGIDLAGHIDLKLRYNATRPAKHGKAY